MSIRFKDKVVIVTGGSSGIGRSICLAFNSEGANVINADIDAEGAAATSELAKSNVVFVRTDVSNSDDVAKLVDQVIDQHGRTDYLINNAAVDVGGDVLSTDEETWDREMRVTLKSVYLCCKAVLPHMIAQKTGSIINISTGNAIVAYGYSLPYSAAKAAVNNLTQNMALNYGEHGIRVNAVAPGTVRTPVHDHALEHDPKWFDRLGYWHPLGGVGDPDDIAKAILFLASEDASWITGAILPVDGGVTAGVDAMKLLGVTPI